MTSPDGTRCPPAPSLTDPNAAVWSLDTKAVPGGYRVLKDLVQFNSGVASLLAIANGGIIYAHNDNGNWYQATATGWKKLDGDPFESPPTPVVADTVTVSIDANGTTTTVTINPDGTAKLN